MMTVTEKVAYLKGLVEGLDFDKDDKETKVINAVLDVLEDLALAVSDLDDEMVVVTEQLDAVDEDLADLEEIFYEEYDDCDCDCDDCKARVSLCYLKHNKVWWFNTENTTLI